MRPGSATSCIWSLSRGVKPQPLEAG
jgi:hypothetical protein